jgi:hypothetical protein
VAILSHFFFGFETNKKGVRFSPFFVLAFYLLHFVFGGPILSWDALAFAAYLTSVFVFPEKSSEALKIDSVEFPYFGSPSVFLCSGLIAAWIGCFVIPLDWDVHWQVFPVASSLLCAGVAVLIEPILSLRPGRESDKLL